MKAISKTDEQAPGDLLATLYRMPTPVMLDGIKRPERGMARYLRSLDNVLARLVRAGFPVNSWRVSGVPPIIKMIRDTATRAPDTARKVEEREIFGLLVTRVYRFAKANPRSSLVRRRLPKTASALRRAA